MMVRIAGLVLVFLMTGVPCFAGEHGPVSVSEGDRCPVCGMYVAKYPAFLAQIVFKDKSYAVFDGAKDMFKYYFNMQKYEKKKQNSDIDSIYVTDYYNLKIIDARKAFFVKGGNVFGPMGKELIAFETQEDANEFMVDHSGEMILRFDQITTEIIKTLD